MTTTNDLITTCYCIFDQWEPYSILRINYISCGYSISKVRLSRKTGAIDFFCNNTWSHAQQLPIAINLHQLKESMSDASL